MFCKRRWLRALLGRVALLADASRCMVRCLTPRIVTGVSDESCTRAGMLAYAARLVSGKSQIANLLVQRRMILFPGFVGHKRPVAAYR